MDLFWLTDEQFSAISPHLPTDTRGNARVDDRRVISGIVYVLASGTRWLDTPADYGLMKTLYNRFVRWEEKGIWGVVFQVLARAGGPSAEALMRSPARMAYLCARAENDQRKPLRAAAREARKKPRIASQPARAIEPSLPG